MPITKPTVLVLGAGASAPFGLPLGRDLRNMVCGLSSGTFVFQQLAPLGHSNDDIQAFMRELRYSADGSVDAFLEGNPEYLEIGKRIIAALLLPLEIERNLFPPAASGSNWYEYLANVMAVGTHDLSANALSIITFNYDRSFEHYFSRVISQRCRIPLGDAHERLRAIPIVHVHGSLGAYGATPDGGLYGPTVNPEAVQRAAENIRIVSAVADTDPVFDVAEELLDRAQRILFLGFGYLPANVRRLRTFETPARPGRLVDGTSVGIPERRWQQIKNEVLHGHWNGGRFQSSILGYLEQWADLD